MLNALKGVKIGIPFAGKECWIGALWVVSLPEPCYSSIKLSWFLLYTDVSLMYDCISMFSLFLILN